MDPLEAALLEDNKEVLAALEHRNRTRGSASSEGGKIGRGSSPHIGTRSPTQILLDTENEGHRRSSMGFSTSYINHSPRIPNAHMALHRSLLETNTPPASKTSRSAATSPTEPSHRAALSNGGRHRTSSDASNHPASFGPRTGTSTSLESNNHVSGNLPSNSGGHVVPKRSTQTSGWAKKLVPSAMAEVVRGGDLSVFGAGDRGRNHSTGSLGTRLSKSRSPGGWGLRSSSPAGKGKQADRRTSDPKTRPANSSLSSALSNRPRAGSAGSVDNHGPNGPRLKKSHVIKNGVEVVDDSSEETNSSDEDQRGRKKSEGRTDQVSFEELKAEQRKYPAPRNLFEAMDQERDQIVIITERKQRQNSLKSEPRRTSLNLPETQHNVRSASDPEITVTGPSGERSKSSRPKCRPMTSFEHSKPIPKLGAARPVVKVPVRSAGKREVNEAQINNPDAQADVRDIVHAQKLPIYRTVITNPHPSRSVRQIYRGDFMGIQRKAKDPKNEHPRRLRKYLVATDLSSEATHALEWCVGTVLRDGDTLLAVYCVDEEVGITPPEGEVADEIQEHAFAIAQAAATPIFAATNPSIAVASGLPKLDSGTLSVPSSPMGRRPKAEQERYRAVREITERVEKLLRKTMLQVKVVIEVIHCKSPKHLITEVIDLVSPTLVILGSRGRSALKGVILGSFSNYLVTKSSVPVMVARKKLHNKKKFKRPETQHANNLANAAVKTMIAATHD